MPAAKQCVAVSSRRVLQFILMCDQTLSVWYRSGVCCNYPGTNARWFQQAIAAPRPGRWVHQYLHRKMAYRIIPAPCPPVGCGAATVCCPGTTVPLRLYCTIMDTGGCGCMAGTYEIDYDAGTQHWVFSGTVCGSGTFQIILDCLDLGTPHWRLTIQCNAFEVPSQVADAGGSCHPFDQSFTGPALVFANCCAGTVTARVTA